jgi:hypothetical protein
MQYNQSLPPEETTMPEEEQTFDAFSMDVEKVQAFVDALTDAIAEAAQTNEENISLMMDSRTASFLTSMRDANLLEPSTTKRVTDSDPVQPPPGP